jgi:hypothetical protein
MAIQKLWAHTSLVRGYAGEHSCTYRMRALPALFSDRGFKEDNWGTVRSIRFR